MTRPTQDLRDFELGRPAVNRVSGTCCGKAVGCLLKIPGCIYMSHPWKRIYVLGESGVRCQAKCVRDGVEMQCVLTHPHEGQPCEPKP